MKKIPTIFERDWEGTRLVRDIPNPAASWVFAGEGRATAKIDGTSCLWHDGRLWKRREIKPGSDVPCSFVEVDRDAETGKIVGWLPVSESDPSDKHHMAALGLNPPLVEGQTYELIGPKVQGNHYGLDTPMLVRHGDIELGDVPRDFSGIAAWLQANPNTEGVVWHHPDGRMAKIKRRDFGLKW